MLIALWKTSSLQHERRQEFKHTYTIPNIWDDIAIHLKHETNLTCYWSAWTKQGSELSCMGIDFAFFYFLSIGFLKCVFFRILFLKHTFHFVLLLQQHFLPFTSQMQLKLKEISSWQLSSIYLFRNIYMYKNVLYMYMLKSNRFFFIWWNI